MDTIKTSGEAPVPANTQGQERRQGRTRSVIDAVTIENSNTNGANITACFLVKICTLRHIFMCCMQGCKTVNYNLTIL